jgi:hypothetical protein
MTPGDRAQQLVTLMCPDGVVSRAELLNVALLCVELAEAPSRVGGRVARALRDVPGVEYREAWFFDLAGDKCSVCRRSHGREIVHPCE